MEPRPKHRIGRRVLLAAGALAASVAGLVAFRYHRNITRARARIASGSRVIQSPCGPIEYAEAGQGPPVLVIHGAGGGFDQGLEFGRPLIAAGFRVIAPSRFGYLRTPMRSDASPAAQADAHACLLDALHLPRVAVAGGSMGSPSAMQFCLRHPERCSALVLLFPIAYAPRPAGQPLVPPSAVATWVMKTTLHSDFLFWMATWLARDTLTRTILATPVEDVRNASPEEQQRASEVLEHILPISEREKGIWSDAEVAPAIPRFDLERLTVPTLVIAAQDDLYGTYRGGRYTAERIPGARFIGFPTGGHLLVGHGQEVSSEIVAFLRAHSN